MWKWLTDLDRLLRGETTRPETLREGRFEVAASGLAIVIVLLGAIYGLCMGSYSLFKVVPETLVDPQPWYMQLVASAIKVPALFYLTLFVTFPSLYVFNALVGSRLTLLSLLRLLVGSLAVNLAVVASLGPIVLFFSLTTQSYPFIQLLNVVVFSVAGVLGLSFLLQTLHRLTMVDEVNIPATAPSNVSPEASELAMEVVEPSALDMPAGQALGEHTRTVFGCWIVLFAVVGAQMSWVLRPFIGNPNLPFTWFRERRSNFFEEVFNSISNLLTGGG
ncbi:MAG: hypothetical protein WD468_09910 [Pirellulales bacterium]